LFITFFTLKEQLYYFRKIRPFTSKGSSDVRWR